MTPGPVSLGTFEPTPSAFRYVEEVMRTGRLSYGPFSQRFEAEFASVHDSDFAVLSNSGTSALQLALQALKELRGWEDGDEVLVPAVTFVATVNVILHNRLKPVLVDVEPDFYGIDPGAIEGAITDRTRAIMPVHLFGMPCDMTRIMEVARARGLAVIEDSAETMFARHAGRMTGSFGDAAGFSTYVAHLLVTGIGGLTTTSDPDVAVRVRSLANHGRDGIYISIDDDRVGDALQREQIVERRFKFDHLGHSYRITELESALGCAGLEGWEEMVAARREHAAYLTELLEPYEGLIQLPRLRPDTEHSFMMYPLVLRAAPKGDLVQHLERNGIETRDMLPILPQPVYQDILEIEPGRYPAAERIDASGFYVGCHQHLTPAHMDHVAVQIGRYLERRG